ncbi:MAG: MOSC domain-containing protein [Deltaproteobacteria bacterium]|jgi:MOSC domain-containing protein YiiM|nr:MOSC domain-containing protein [Deltaproteobacteria bacterium]MBK7067367.1 MOSC domain-containing protein [Deltaproteobacteria bacterium]MBK8695879.1 MOSC domain-containing protein [Deltaproteobacteria bacterium]MBP6830213.1 MOSC domain-containing protein [Deltaproteobacteria bacterium]
MPGTLEAIHVFRERRGPPILLAEAVFVAGRGVPTDQRDRPGVPRPVSAIRAETIDHVARALGIAIAPGSSRRNLTIRALDLDTLPRGTVLSIGEARFEVIAPCDACVRMESALGPGAPAHMQGRGGIALTIVQGGRVACGDVVEVAVLGTVPLYEPRERPRGW